LVEKPSEEATKATKEKKKSTHGTKNLMVWTKTSVLPTTWQFDPDIPLDSLAVAGYIFCPPPGENCSGVMITKNAIDSKQATTGGKPEHPESAANVEAEYSTQASSTQI
jgi:hypothetical protein